MKNINFINVDNFIAVVINIQPPPLTKSPFLFIFNIFNI